MMDIQHNILCATILTAVFIASQSKLALLFPVWAIVPVSAALPAVMVWATVVCMKTLEAAVFGRHTRGLCLTIERIATVLAEKLLGLALPGSQIAGTAAVVPDRIRRASIEAKGFAALLADKLNEWVLSVDVGLVPVAVVLATVICLKTSTGAKLTKWSEATYLAVKGFATMMTNKFAGESIRCFGSSITTLAAVFPRRLRGIGSKAETLAAMFADNDRWGLSGADDSTSGYAPRFDLGAHLPEMVLING